MNSTSIAKIFQTFAKANPSPGTELKYRNHFELLIAVMLSAQATDVSVNKVTPLLFQIAPTPKKMMDLGESGIRKKIQSIGLYSSKAKHIYATCRILIEKFQSRVPSNRADLESLPGVGTKTAGVILNVAFGQPVIPVDTHVFRVANRLGIVRTDTVLSTEKGLMKKIPSQYLVKAHHWLILHGRYICKARTPLCQECVVYNHCEYEKKEVRG